MKWLLQLDDLYTRWLIKGKGNDISTVTADEIVEMGNLARGIMADDIDAMPVDLYT